MRPTLAQSARAPWPRERGRDCAAAGDGFIENFAEIAAEQTPLSKAAPVAPFRFEALGEMVGLARPGAHALGPDVEEMRRLGRRISDSATGSAAAVDQRRLDSAPGKLSRKDSARSAPPDDCDRDRRVRFHNPASSPDWPRPPCGCWIWSYMRVDGLPGSLGEPARHQRMDQARAACTDQRGTDDNRARAMLRPAHPERTRMIEEEPVDHARFALLLSSASPPFFPCLSILATPTGFEPVALRLGI